VNTIRRKFLRAMAGADWSNGQRRRYARQLEASVDHLGDRWLLAKPQPRRATREPAPIPTVAAAIRQWRATV
jgi:hypothetical protein